MSATYEKEQAALRDKLAQIETALATYHADSSNIEAFMTLARQYQDAGDLTASIINSFIDRVIVHAPQKINGQRSVRIEIIFRFIGSFTVPTAESQSTAEASEEEDRRAKEREKNHQKYLRRKERKKKLSRDQTAA